MEINIERLTGNKDQDLDTFLLHSSKFTQEEREVVMEGVAAWVVHITK